MKALLLLAVAFLLNCSTVRAEEAAPIQSDEQSKPALSCTNEPVVLSDGTIELHQCGNEIVVHSDTTIEFQ